jgi:hypothetical protein
VLVAVRRSAAADAGAGAAAAASNEPNRVLHDEQTIGSAHLESLSTVTVLDNSPCMLPAWVMGAERKIECRLADSILRLKVRAMGPCPQFGTECLLAGAHCGAV